VGRVPRPSRPPKQAAGKVTTNRYGGSYTNFGGNPRPDLLNFFPAMSNGSYTGTFNGPWHVTGNDRYIIMGGEFNRVNFQGQQGLVRFARRDLAPNNQGPYLFNATFPIRAQSFWDGTVTVSWPGNIDRDEANLTYRVLRRAVGTSGGGDCCTNAR
jgi:trimeric autotransporter adhesin